MKTRHLRILFILSLGLTLALLWLVKSPSTGLPISRAAGPWYVAPGGDDGNDCLSAGTACATINGALNKPGFVLSDTVRVAIGIYTGTGDEVVLLDKDVILSGGWDGTFTTQGGTSTIDGQGSRRGITVNSGVTTTVDRFTIQNGYTGGSGGGIYNGGTLALTNSTVSNNTAFYYGGGIHGTSGSSTVIMDSQIYGNTAANDQGGGISSDGGDVHLVSSWVVGNVTENNEGGGVSVGGGSFYGENCIIAGNYAGTSAGGLWLYQGGPYRIVNCDVVGNETPSEGGAIATAYSTQIEITNTLIISNWGNTGIADRDGSGSVFLLNYCDTYGNSPDGMYGVTINRTNCLGMPPEDGLDPLVAGGALPGGVGPAFAAQWMSYDYSLQVDSPAIDAGVDAGVPDDIDGNPRTDGYPDIGAYELVSTRVFLSPPTQADSSETGSTVTYTVWLNNHTGATDSFTLTIQPGNAWATTLSLTQTGALADGDSLPLTVWVEIPPLASPGDMDSVTIQATSVTSPSVYSDTATIQTSVMGAPAYVTLSDSDLVALVDTATHAAIGSIDVGAAGCSYPWRAAMSPDGTYVYVACRGSGNVAVIETVGNTVMSMISGISSAGSIAFVRDGAYALVGSRHDSQVAVVDTATRSVINYIYTPSNARSVAAHPYLDVAYATSGDGSVQVIDTTSFDIITAIPVGSDPYDVAVSPDGGWVFAGSRQGDGLAVIAAGSNTLHTTVTDLGYLTGLEVAPDGSAIYASGLWNGVHVIDGATFSYITTIEGVGSPREVAVTCDGGELYVGNKEDQVPVVDTGTFSVVDQIALPGWGAQGSAICPQARQTGLFLVPATQSGYDDPGGIVVYEEYLVNATGQTDSFTLSLSGNVWDTSLSIADTGPLADGDSIAFTVQVTIPVSASPGEADSVTIQATSVTSPTVYSDTAAIQTSAAGAPAYVTLSDSNLVALVDTAAHAAIGSVDVGAAGCSYPWRAAMSPDGAYVYVACRGSGNVVVIETAGNTVVVTVGGIPSAGSIAFVRGGAYALVGSRHDSQVAVVDTATYSVVSYISTPSYARSVAAHPYLDVAYATSGDGNVLVIDTTSFDIIATVPVGYDPYDVAVSPDGGWVFAGSRWGDGLAVIAAGSNTLHTTVTGLGDLTGLEVAPDGSAIYASGLWNGVHVIDGATFSHITTIEGVGSPREVAVTCDGGELYVGNKGNQVPVVDTGTLSVVDQITLPGWGAQGSAICPQARQTGLFLVPATQSRYDGPGGIVVYEEHLVNATGQTDSFTLSLSGNAWDTSLSIADTGPLADGDSIAFTVQVTIPVSASPGDMDSVTIQATSVTSPTVYSDTATIQTSAVGALAYVTLSEDDLVALVDTANHTVLGSINVGAAGCDFPWRATMSPDGAYVYVGCYNSGNVAVVETTGNTVVTTVDSIPSADGIAFTRDGAYALVGSRWSNQIAVVDAAVYAVTSYIPTTSNARSVAAHPYLDLAYATSGDGNVLIIDTTTFSIITTIPVGDDPWDVAVSPDGQWVLAGSRQGDGLAVVDAGSNTLHTTVTGIGDLAGLDVAPDGSAIYAAGLWDGVHVIDGTTFDHVTTVEDVGTVWEVAVTCDGSELYVGNREDQVPVIDTATWQRTSIAMPGSATRGIAICPQYVATGVFLSPPAQTNPGGRGQVVAHEALLVNATGATDSFGLALGSHAWDTVLSADSLGPIANGDSLTFTVYVTVPVDAAWYSTDVVEVTATSVASPAVYSDTATFTTQAYAPPEISVSPDELASTQYVNDVVIKPLTISNGSGVTLTFDLVEMERPSLFLRTILSSLHVEPLASEKKSKAVSNYSGPNTGEVDAFPSIASEKQVLQGHTVLIIQDYYPWGYDSIQQVLSANSIGYDQVDSSQIPAIDLSSYELVIIPSVQGGQFYSTWDTNIARFEAYVEAGGVLWLSTCTQGTEPLLPGGVINVHGFDDYNDIVEPAHPWVANVPNPMWGSSASHNSFTSLHPGSLVVAQAQGSGNATLVDYAMGLGRILLTGQTLEFAWDHSWDGAPILENSLLDMFAWEPTLDISWLSEEPISGTVTTDGSTPVQVTFDATGLQPGDYTAEIIVRSNDPITPSVSVLTTMTVLPPPNMGWVEGTVTDARTGDPLEATIVALGQPCTITTDPDTGTYKLWLKVGSYTLQAAATGYVTETAVVRIRTHKGTTQDFDLVLNVPVLEVAPDSLQVTEEVGEVAMRTLTIANNGPAPLTFELYELDAGSSPSLASLLAVRADTPGPAELAQRLASTTAYVTLSGNDLVALVDTSAHTEIGSVDVGAAGCNFPWRATMSPDGDYVYVSCYNSGNVAVIETNGNTVVTMVGGIPSAGGIAFTRDGAYALVGSRWSGQVAVVDTATHSVVTYIYTPSNARSVAAHPYLDVAYVTSGDGNVLVIDTTTFSVITTIPVGDDPWDVAVSPDGQWVFAGSRWGDGLAVIDADSNTVHTTVTGLGDLTGLAVAPDGSAVYAAGIWSGVHVIDGKTFDHITTVSSPGRAWEVAVTCDEGELYVGNTESDVPVIDTATFSLIEQIAMPGWGARGIAICPQYVVGDVPWLSEEPISGTVPGYSSTPVQVTFDASQVAQPGIYQADLQVSSNDPYTPVLIVPVMLTASAPETWGKLNGTVAGLGYCNADPAPLEDAKVFIEGHTGMTWTLTTDISGTYQLWLDETNSPLTVTVTYPEHEVGIATGVLVTGQVTTTVNFALRRLLPCLSVDPDSLAVTVDMGVSTTLPLTLTNSGAVSTTFEISEANRGFAPTMPILRTLTLLPDDHFNWTSNGDVPWLSAQPISGTVEADSTVPIAATFDAGVSEVNQPGDYLATIFISPLDAPPPPPIPVTMTVPVDPNMGKITGVVTSDRPGGPLEDALVEVISGTSSVIYGTTDASGLYGPWWLMNGTYTVTVSAVDYLTDTQSVSISAGVTTTHDVALVLNAPLLEVSPESLEVAHYVDDVTIQTLAITNDGPAPLDFEIGSDPRLSFFAASTELYGYDVPDAWLRVVGTQDDTHVQVIDLDTGFITEHTDLDRYETWDVYPSDGTPYKVDADKPVVGHESDLDNFWGYTTFVPSLDSGPVGKEFIFHYHGTNYYFYVFAVEDASVEVYDTSGSLVASQTMSAQEYWDLSLSDAVYHVISTGRIAMEAVGSNGYTTVPSSEGNGVGRRFYFATTGNTGAFAVFAYQDVDVNVYDLDSDSLLYSQHINHGDYWWQTGVGTRRLWLESTGGVEVWAGDRQTGYGIEHLGDDLSFAGGDGSREYYLHSLMDGSVIFAPFDNTQVNVDGTVYQLNKDEYLHLDGCCYFRHIQSSQPVLIQTLGRDDGWDDLGTYLGGVLTRGSGLSPWLTTDPITGTVPAYSSAQVQVTFDATGMQPGDHTAEIIVQSNDPITPTASIPVTMTVLPTANMGWVEGIVTDAGTGDPLEATIVAWDQPYTITTDPDTGYYKLWLKAGRYTLQATAAGYVTETAVVSIKARKGITQDFGLVGADAGGIDRHRVGQRPQLAHVLRRERAHCCRIRAATATSGPQPARPPLPVLVSRRL